MKIYTYPALLSLLFTNVKVAAELTPWEDYEIANSLYLFTTIKLEPNMGDAWLQGLKNTWIPQENSRPEAHAGSRHALNRGGRDVISVPAA